jgi:acetylornithine deacetylase/succinyl-diaminopimelate desuccinylase-like protein
MMQALSLACNAAELLCDGYVFTGEPLKLAAGHFGLGDGSGAHAPDEYYVIESANPKIQGFDGAVMSFVEYLYELAK